MTKLISYIDDRRGFLLTINLEPDPVYQVESSVWAHVANRWAHEDIPPEIHDKVAHLKVTGKPGAFVRFLHSDVGVYVLYEKNIKNLPEPADDDDIVVDPGWRPESERKLSPYDIVICAKGGAVGRADSGETYETQEGDYYVIRCQSWGRLVLNPPLRPSFVETSKDFLLLLESLHRKNYLSMCPDPTIEVLPPDFGDCVPVPEGLNCYVLNLARFKR